MRTLTRYVLADLLKVFFAVLIGMTMMMMLVGVLKEAVTQGLGIMQVLRLMPYILPDALRFSIPGTILFAACSVYGRMSSANELIAIKALGISPMVVIWPVVSITFAMSLAAVWINDLAVSWGHIGVQRVVLESVEEIAYGMLRTRRSYSTRQFAINVKSVEGRTLVKPTFSFRPDGDAPLRTVTADEAQMRSNPEDNTLTVVCRNGTVSVGDSVRVAFPDTREWVIPLTDASRKGGGPGGPSHLPLRVIPSEIVAQRVRIREQRQRIATVAACQMMVGQLSDLGASQWDGSDSKLANLESNLYRLKTEPHRRWANGFSCLCFVMVGAPLAIRMRNADFLTSFFLCFMPILVVYYPLLAFGVDQAKSGGLPPYSVWMGNVMLLAIGALLLRKVIRY